MGLDGKDTGRDWTTQDRTGGGRAGQRRTGWDVKGRDWTGCTEAVQDV